MLLGFIGIYLLATLAIGWWASRRVKTTRDFVIAGRGLPLAMAATALFATWFGSETIMGSSSEFVQGGVLAVIKDPFGASLCLLLVGMFFARPLYKLNILTFNDFFRRRFSRRTEFISAVFMVPSYFGWIAAQLVAMAFVLKTLAGIDIGYGIALCAVIVVFYTYIGGMWAVSVTDFFQSILILVGLLALGWQMYHQVGGFKPVIAAQPEGFFNILPPADFGSISVYIAAWITVGFGSIPQQDVFQRVMAARTENTAVKAAYLAAALYLVIGAIPLFIGLCGKILYPDMQNDDNQMIIPRMVLEHSGMGLQILFFGALLSAILSTTSGAMLAPATVIGENLIKPYFRELSDKSLLRIMRTSVLGVALCSALMAGRDSNIFHLAEQSSSLSLVALFVPLTAGLYWKRASDVGATASVVLGMSVWIWFEYQGHETAILPGLLASIAGMLLGSILMPDESFRNFETWRIANQAAQEAE